jgi:hypothetical protein
MKPGINIASKLLQLAGGAELPASSFSAAFIRELVEENIVQERIQGRTKRMLYINNPVALYNWLVQKHGINSLEQYIATLQNDDATRAYNIQAAGDSKLRSVRTFKGFLVNAPQPINAILNEAQLTLHTPPGAFQFIYDYDSFKVPEDVLIVGVENAEVFRHANKLQRYLDKATAIFVSRYPQEQGKDLRAWLQRIPNYYIHFGDYDFAGMNIYVQEYKKYLGDRAMFFMPGNLDELLQQYGNAALYDQQKLNALTQQDKELMPFMWRLHAHKKGLEQEVLLL